jgi:hypothetical protein
MLLLTLCFVGLGEALLGFLGWSGGPLPDAALVLSLVAAFRLRRDGDLALALVAGLASGLFGTGPWGLKALICLAACLTAGAWRGGERRVRGVDALLRSAIILTVIGLVEFLGLLAANRAGWWEFVSLLARGISTAALVGLIVGLESRAQPART